MNRNILAELQRSVPTVNDIVLTNNAAQLEQAKQFISKLFTKLRDCRAVSTEGLQKVGVDDLRHDFSKLHPDYQDVVVATLATRGWVLDPITMEVSAVAHTPVKEALRG